MERFEIVTEIPGEQSDVQAEFFDIMVSDAINMLQNCAPAPIEPAVDNAVESLSGKNKEGSVSAPSTKLLIDNN